MISSTVLRYIAEHKYECHFVDCADLLLVDDMEGNASVVLVQISPSWIFVFGDISKPRCQYATLPRNINDFRQLIVREVAVLHHLHTVRSAFDETYM